MDLKYEAKGKGKCPCPGNLGWVQRVTDPKNGAWRCENAATIPERLVAERHKRGWYKIPHLLWRAAILRQSIR